MEREELRISQRENVRYAGRDRTAFSVHQWSDEARAYVFAGQYSVPRHDATEEQCKRAAAMITTALDGVDWTELEERFEADDEEWCRHAS
ncbi:MAG: hypothetical protein ACRCWC_07045 [Plesiomonas shigelloides]